MLFCLSQLKYSIIYVEIFFLLLLWAVGVGGSQSTGYLTKKEPKQMEGEHAHSKQKDHHFYTRLCSKILCCSLVFHIAPNFECWMLTLSLTIALALQRCQLKSAWHSTVQYNTIRSNVDKSSQKTKLILFYFMCTYSTSRHTHKWKCTLLPM